MNAPDPAYPADRLEIFADQRHPAVQRRLAAILSADIQGYSLLMAADEEAAHPRVCRSIRHFSETLQRADGKIIALAGDGLLAEFPSSVTALRFAVALQAYLEREGAADPPHERIRFRIGLHVGDILVHQGALGGDSVNIAARLQQLADPGGICVSRGAYEQVHRIVRLEYSYIGEIALKNISTPVEVFKVGPGPNAPGVVAGARTAAAVGSPDPARPRPKAALSIAVLGPLRATVEDCEVRLRSRKAQAVLVYLALCGNGRETRERLVGLLWSESAEAKARASLRQTLHELREALAAAGYEGLGTAGQLLALDAATVSVDVAAVLGRVEVGQDLLLRPQILDSFLQGFDDVDPAFDLWVQAKRQAVRDAMLRQLEDGLRRPELAAERRLLLCQALLALDPTHEEACRCVMRGRVGRGDVAGALRSYEALWRLLGDEYDTEPLPETQALVAQIKLGQFDPPAPAEPRRAPPPAAIPAAVSRATKLALVVEPFVMEDVEATRSHLVEGFRRNLIACLVRFREWFVLEGDGGRAPRVTHSSVSVAYQLSAAAGQIGKTAYLALTLREIDSNLYVWSERFELSLDRWFETQQRIVRRIAMTLNVQLSAERLGRLAAEPDVALQVYDKWLRGQAMISRFDPEVWDRAGQLFNEAASEAPNFSLALSSLAEMNNSVHIAHPGILRDPAKALATVEIGRRAVALDPTDSRAQLCLGWSHAMAKQFPQAAVHMELAAELNPNDSWTLMSSALFHAFYGEFDRARALANESLDMSLTPTATHWAYQMNILFLAQDYEAAIEAGNHAQDVIRTLPAWRAASLFHLGHTEAAAADARRFLADIRRRWFGIAPPTDAAIGSWLLHLYPISDAAHWERLRLGVSGAGIPDSGIRHNAW